MIAYLWGLVGPRERKVPMRPHDPRDLYALGIGHRLLDVKARHPMSEYQEIFTQVDIILEQFIQSEFNNKELGNAVEAARELTVLVRGLAKAPSYEFDETGLENIFRRGYVDRFESALGIDVKALPLFLVEDKRGYSSKAFIRDASVVFSKADIAMLADLTLDDVAEAGKSLLLDRHTAAGFHTMRALEAVVRGYYRMIFNKDPTTAHGDPLGLGGLANQLNQYRETLLKAGKPIGGLDDIVPTLARVARIYRNPIMHPEMVLDEDLAIEVFDDAKSAIATILRDVRTEGPHFSVLWSQLNFSWSWVQP
jgi:hypothetical protein